jgi:hypothetical protein
MLQCPLLVYSTIIGSQLSPLHWVKAISENTPYNVTNITHKKNVFSFDGDVYLENQTSRDVWLYIFDSYFNKLSHYGWLVCRLIFNLHIRNHKQSVSSSSELPFSMTMSRLWEQMISKSRSFFSYNFFMLVTLHEMGKGQWSQWTALVASILWVRRDLTLWHTFRLAY